MDLWFELHQRRQRHPKTLKLSAKLSNESLMINVARRYACGLLDDLWAWALDEADIDGRLKGIGAEELAIALDYPSETANDLLAALRDCGFIDVLSDGTLAIHDWRQYAGKLNEQREKDRLRKTGRQRMTSQRNSTGFPSENIQNSGRDTVDIHTLPPPPPIGGSSGGYIDISINPFSKEYEDVILDTNNIVVYVESNINHLSPGNYEQLRSYLTDTDDSLIRLAVDEAVAHQAKNWAYVRAVLDRWTSAGYKTAEDVKANDTKLKKVEKRKDNEHLRQTDGFVPSGGFRTD